MKFIAFAAAGLMAAMAIAPTPAEAQRHGYGHDRGWNGDRGWRDDRGWRGDRRGWRGDRRGWRGNDRGWRGNRGRGNVRCTWVRGWDGPQRQCYRVWR